MVDMRICHGQSLQMDVGILVAVNGRESDEFRIHILNRANQNRRRVAT